MPWSSLSKSCFRLQRYKLLKAIHNGRFQSQRNYIVVSDYKDTNFWKQFTTFAFVSNSCKSLFQTTKIQTFESNSQLHKPYRRCLPRCFRLQRYKLLKAIHNNRLPPPNRDTVVSDYKDTNFWKQFTTFAFVSNSCKSLFQTTKIQTFESNSQLHKPYRRCLPRCFRLQRYKLLKAIHNLSKLFTANGTVVSDYKDTNFWKQFTTPTDSVLYLARLFQTTKIQTFESNSQPSG